MLKGRWRVAMHVSCPHAAGLHRDCAFFSLRTSDEHHSAGEGCLASISLWNFSIVRRRLKRLKNEKKAGRK
jgi:hypothetical protein